jgi:hypothetical protein
MRMDTDKMAGLDLTEADGTRHEFTPGQMVVLPLGYTGNLST